VQHGHARAWQDWPGLALPLEARRPQTPASRNGLLGRTEQRCVKFHRINFCITAMFTWLSFQRIKQCFGLLQIPRVKAFGEPVIHRGKQVMGSLAFPLLLPESSQARSSTEFERFGPLAARTSPQKTPKSGRPCDSNWKTVGSNAWPTVAFVVALKPTSRP
jgi:hypothetical protein